MTDAPRTTMLFTEEWRSLCVGSAQQLVGFFANVPHPTPEALELFEQHMARLKMFATAWGATPVLQAPKQQAPAGNPFGTRHNGASEPKRKGGWPKGKSRKSRAPAEVVQ